MTKKEQLIISMMNTVPTMYFNTIETTINTLKKPDSFSISFKKEDDGYSVDVVSSYDEDNVKYKTTQFIGLPKTKVIKTPKEQPIRTQTTDLPELTEADLEKIEELKTYFRTNLQDKMTDIYKRILAHMTLNQIAHETNSSSRSVHKIKMLMRAKPVVKEAVSLKFTAEPTTNTTSEDIDQKEDIFSDTDKKDNLDIDAEVETAILQDLIDDKDIVEIAFSHSISTGTIKDIEKRFANFIKERKQLKSKTSQLFKPDKKKKK